MSEEAPGPPDSTEPPQLERRSLLAVWRERRNRAAEGRFPLHRLLVVARLGEGAAAEEVAGHHRGLFENALEDHSGEHVSGLLLLCPSYICHVVESCSSTIHLVIQDLASLQNQGPNCQQALAQPSALESVFKMLRLQPSTAFTGFRKQEKPFLRNLLALLQEIKVLVVAHNIPTRLFPDWYVAIATSPVASPQGSTQSDSTAEVVAERLTLLLKLAAYIQSLEDDSEDANESVHTLEPELLIPAETINYLCNAEECTSPEDFLRIYLSPSQPVLDSETVWPVPSRFSV